MPPEKPDEILIDGEAMVEVLGQVEAAILVREAEGPVTAMRAGDDSNDLLDRHVRCGRDLDNSAVLFGDGSKKEANRGRRRARGP